MPPMTARPPRRRRRTDAPAATLPRPTASPAAAGEPLPARRTIPGRVREHHVAKDYGYVKRDLLGIAAVGAVTLAFIVAMSFIVQ